MARSSARVDVKKGTFQSVCERRKTLLVRVDDIIFIRFVVGEVVKVCSGDRSCTCRILDVRRYQTLEGILKSENLEKIAHGSHQEANIYLSQIYHDVPASKEYVVLELQLMKIGHKDVARD